MVAQLNTLKSIELYNLNGELHGMWIMLQKNFTKEDKCSIKSLNGN